MAPLKLKERRKLSTPLAITTAIGLGGSGIRRRFSVMVPAAVTRKLSSPLSWRVQAPVPPHVIRQGRALCLHYTRYRIRRANIQNKKLVLQRLRTMLETESTSMGVEDLSAGAGAGVLNALVILCNALERLRPRLFVGSIRQAARSPATVITNESDLSELSLALAKEICKEKITWAKIACVFACLGSIGAEVAQSLSCGDAAIAGVGGGGNAAALLAAPAAALADLLDEEPGVWVVSHGGWSGLIDYCRMTEEDPRSQRNLNIIIMIGTTFFVTIYVIFRVLIPIG